MTFRRWLGIAAWLCLAAVAIAAKGGVGGSAILGDGTVAFIIDVLALVNRLAG